MAANDKIRILVVEEEPSLHEMIRLKLGKLGDSFEIVGTTGRDEALALFGGSVFDAVIAENDPEPGFAAFVTGLRRIQPEIKIYGIGHFAIDIDDYGLDGCIVKPAMEELATVAVGLLTMKTVESRSK